MVRKHCLFPLSLALFLSILNWDLGKGKGRRAYDTKMPPYPPIDLRTGPEDSDIQDPSNEHEDALGNMQAQFAFL